MAIGGEIALEHVLELIVKRGRALVGARSLVIMLREGEELVVHASAGHATETRGARLPIADSTSGQVLRAPTGRADHRRAGAAADRAERVRRGRRADGAARADGLTAAKPWACSQRLIAACEGSAFAEDDEQMLRTFAASAATAVALAQSVQADRLRSSLAAADAERRRWARELHDETLQSLGGLRVLLSSALRGNDLDRAQDAMRQAVEQIEHEIANLRAIITELRPAALDELGLRVAIEALLDRHREQSGFQVDAELAASRPRSRRGALGPRPRDDRLSDGAGGADQRRQACPRRARASRGQRH